ncbi:putative biphenyl-2,3-diol 1,2-dioxygenase protein [Natronococcus amylolyticus DSM 10524]|uniref:Putative biphenyl-2,3-diol 1,2-dioxygenase protein n=1 Tax=Natronococcus amylolyticus DSM 10524 TaxID=1227497 RepID=L9X567_9EURY|nr:VOC family protein [Natronococcus amylolyticus]ELY56845.1 putative biphenyl-2,3-diol 1,2-dioxygenase protein [Natronococcus amylolyticus DSM 10524]
MNLTGIDHFVLTVEDLERTCAFYEALGAEVVAFDDGRTGERRALQFGEQKINLHPVDTDVEHVAAAPTPGAGDFCLLTETPIAEVEERLHEQNIEIVEGPVERTGTVGRLESVYVRDPDENLVEIGRYKDD